MSFTMSSESGTFKTFKIVEVRREAAANRKAAAEVSDQSRQTTASVSNGETNICFGSSHNLQISSSAESEAQTSSGLVKGHAYSITGLEEVSS